MANRNTTNTIQRRLSRPSAYLPSHDHSNVLNDPALVQESNAVLDLLLAKEGVCKCVLHLPENNYGFSRSLCISNAKSSSLSLVEVR